MKPVRWTHHALQSLVDREIERADVAQAIREPESEVPDPPGRRVLMRRYEDVALAQPMLLRVVVEETPQELVVITVYKTSQISRYMKG
jgi:hypothetical protein